MTVKLYDTDSHMQEFDAVVTSCVQKGKKYAVTLDRTAFFPEGGGQTSDTGMIGAAKVFDVQTENGEIIHYTNKSLCEGECVSCKLDWEPRFRKMQNHSGEHIVSGIVHRMYGYNNVGFHLTADDVTFDFDGELTREQLLEIEYLANKAVAENHAVTAEYPTADRLAELEYRSKLDLTEDVRIVTIEGCDRCACCAPHVKMTGEIGMIKLLDFMRYKGGVRIHMQCGLDALDDYNEKYANILSISAQLSAKQHETAKMVTKFLAELEKQKRSAEAAMKRYTTLRLSMIDASDKNICVFEDDLSEEGLRELVNGMMEKTDAVCAAFSKKDDGGWAYVMGSRTVLMREWVSRMNKALCGKGGGKDIMVQGSVQSGREEIEKYFAQAAE